MNENPENPPEYLVAKFDDIEGSCIEREFPGLIRMVSYSISMPNLLTFVTDLVENQIFIDAWLKKNIFERATFHSFAFTHEGLAPWLTSEFQNVKIENVRAGVTVSRHNPSEGAIVSCSFETCAYKMDRRYSIGGKRDFVKWSHRDGKTVHHQSIFPHNRNLSYRREQENGPSSR